MIKSFNCPICNKSIIVNADDYTCLDIETKYLIEEHYHKLLGKHLFDKHSKEIKLASIS